jgi:hypothetical protein
MLDCTPPEDILSKVLFITMPDKRDLFQVACIVVPGALGGWAAYTMMTPKDDDPEVIKERKESLRPAATAGVGLLVAALGGIAGSMVLDEYRTFLKNPPLAP